ncbi:hypothetical protein HMPREF3216_00072 [Gardnerella vaginalis]|uniref:Uncharacterized protein n=1 Tax=Gardnerella vaginalis TaxID=2702 RepID=A0A133NTA1_GARVA|nr:hypothetical protein HMPREF3216_00072 [Gardnerella vaginalis]
MARNFRKLIFANISECAQCDKCHIFDFSMIEKLSFLIRKIAHLACVFLATDGK